MTEMQMRRAGTKSFSYLYSLSTWSLRSNVLTRLPIMQVYERTTSLVSSSSFATGRHKLHTVHRIQYGNWRSTSENYEKAIKQKIVSTLICGSN